MCNAVPHTVHSREGQSLLVKAYKPLCTLTATNTQLGEGYTELICQVGMRFMSRGSFRQAERRWEINAILQCSTSQRGVNRFTVAGGH